MKIEIARLGRMSQTGSSLLTLYQDKHTPILDLLVRESIQNSLDAGANLHSQAESKDYVEIEFLSGDFTPKSFNDYLEKVSDALNERYNNNNGRYLAIRDRYTAGLTGPLRISDIHDYNYGNLLKLVYDICKPQEGQGAGGSWGIGKTIFYRLGNGIVVFYSRIFDDISKKFQSRLAISLVEDEHLKDSLLPKVAGTCNIGIAWWGKDADDGYSEPITDDNYIEKFLSIFGITPFVGKETGTLILFPYVNENELLANNRANSSLNGNNDTEETIISPSWQKSLDDYLNIAVQRWYFPRLNNKQYKYGKYLRIIINGHRLTTGEMLPIFRLGQALYNCSATSTLDCEAEYIKDNGIKCFVEKIALNKFFISDTCSGNLAYAIVDKEVLGMCAPTNCYSPYNYIDVDEPDGDSNPPVFGFCRKPGMIVSYDNSNDKWLKSVPDSEKGKYIIALFSLNSSNQFADLSLDLEEYVRKSELANHNSWVDYPFEGKTRDIISRIKKNTSSKLCKAFAGSEEKEESRINTGLGQKIANLVLPREGFGKKSRTKSVGIRKNLDFSSHNGVSIALLEDETVYMGKALEATYLIKSLKKSDSFTIANYISTESKPIHPNEWEEDGLSMPFKLKKALIRIEKIDGQDNKITYSLEEGDNIVDDYLSCNWNLTNRGSSYGVSLVFQSQHSFVVTIGFTYSILSHDVRIIAKPE